MHSSGALGALERLFDFTTPTVLHRLQRYVLLVAVCIARPIGLFWSLSAFLVSTRVLARLAAHCEGVVAELEASSSVLALAALVRLSPSRAPQRMTSSQLSRGGSTHSLSLRSAAEYPSG
jgi:hypothetical protein